MKAAPLPRNLPLSPLELRLETVSWGVLGVALFAPVVVRFLALGVFQLPPVTAVIDAVVGFSVMNSAALASLALLYLMARPTRAHLESMVLWALPLEVVYMIGLPAQASWQDRFLCLGGGIGFAGLLGLAHLAWADPERLTQRRAKIYLRIAVGLVLYPVYAGALLGVISHLNPQVYDAYAYNLEASLGWVPSVVNAQFQIQHPWFDWTVVAIYSRLPVWVILAFALGMLYPERTTFDLFLAFFVSGVLVFGFYHLLPLVGVDDFLGLQTWLTAAPPLSVSWEPFSAPLFLPRTCIPSMHMTWILLAYFAALRISRRLGWLYLAFVLATGLAAMGPHVGHYLLDFVPSFPFTLAMIALTSQPDRVNRAWQIFGLVAGLLGTGLYLAAIRWGAVYWTERASAWWTVSLLLVLVSLFGERQLRRADG